MRSLNWGVLGTARINRSVIPAIRAARRSALTAVASRELSRAETFARDWEIPQAYGSYEELLADTTSTLSTFRCRIICTPTWTIAAARAGKHVLCEKPLALTTDDVDRIAEAGSDHSVVITEAFMYRHHAQTRRIQSLVAEARSAICGSSAASFTFPLTREGDVRLRPRMGRRQPVGCRVLPGQPSAADRGRRSAVRQRPGRDRADRDRHRLCGDAAVSRWAPGGIRFRVQGGLPNIARDRRDHGDARRAQPVQAWPRRAALSAKDGASLDIDVEGDALYVGEIADMEAAVIDGSTPTVSLADSRGTVATLVALYAAAASGTRVVIRLWWRAFRSAFAPSGAEASQGGFPSEEAPPPHQRCALHMHSSPPHRVGGEAERQRAQPEQNDLVPDVANTKIQPASATSAGNGYSHILNGRGRSGRCAGAGSRPRSAR